MFFGFNTSIRLSKNDTQMYELTKVSDLINDYIIIKLSYVLYALTN